MSVKLFSLQRLQQKHVYSNVHGIQSSTKVTCLSHKNNAKNTDNINMCMQSDCLTKIYASRTEHTYTVSSRVCQLFHNNDNEMH